MIDKNYFTDIYYNQNADVIHNHKYSLIPLYP